MPTIYRIDDRINKTEKIGEYWTRGEALNVIAFFIELDYTNELKSRTDKFEAFYLGKSAAQNIAAAHDAKPYQTEFLSFLATYRLEA